MEGTATDISTSARSYFETFPRELRDLIYDQLYQEVNEIVSGLGFQARAILPRLRLVSRQFKAEYDERIVINDLKQQLTVTDTGSTHYEHCSILVCSPTSTHTTCLTIKMVEDSNCCHILADAWLKDGTITWLNEFVRQLPLLRKFRFRVCVSVSDSGEMVWILAHILLKIHPMLTELEVVSWDGAPQSLTPLKTWSKEHGTQTHDDAIDRHSARYREVTGY
jgi:hypothetical protein